MCILFFCQSEICQHQGYRLILANNRDEKWHRPTADADFWSDNKSCIGGIDMQPGREGGTWLGMNSNGKIGVLLNVLGQEEHGKKGRGSLVSNFISGTTDIEEYAASVQKEKGNYNGFNLVLFDLGVQDDSLSYKPLYISNAKNYNSIITKRSLPANAFFSVSNSPLEYPFQKVEQGRQKFGNILCHHPMTSSRDHLINNLMDFLSDRTPLLPDPVLEVVAGSVGFSPLRTGQHSAINVHSPAQEYGSRTSTVILVDGEGRVDYVERNLEYSQEGHTSTARTIHKVFQLESTFQTSHVSML